MLRRLHIHTVTPPPIVVPPFLTNYLPSISFFSYETHNHIHTHAVVSTAPFLSVLGRDLIGGGTWLGVNRSGKFATVTNVTSTWDEFIAFIKGKTAWRRAFISSTVVAAAAIAAGAFIKRKGNPWPLSFGLICVGIVTASVGIAVAVTAGLRKSRGTLVSDFLKGDESAEQYCTRLSKASCICR